MTESFDPESLTLFRHDRYEDITEDFTACCDELGPHELRIAENFQLMDGVHSLEIGNDRMDTGMRYRPFADDLAKVPAIEAAQDTARLMDLLVAREMSWHSGASMMQNVLSCLFVEDVFGEASKIVSQPGMARDEVLANAVKFMNQWSVQLYDDSQSPFRAVLNSYIIGMAKSISMSLELTDPASSAVVYGDEDIVNNAFGCYLFAEIPTSQVAEMLEKVAKWSRLHGYTQLADRIRLRIAWLHILQQRVPKKPIHLETSLQLITSIREDIDSMLSSSPELISKYDSAFGEGAQTRLQNPSPFAPLVALEVKEAYDLIEQVVNVVSNARAVHSIERSVDLFAFFLTFSEQTPNKLPISRAILKAATIPLPSTILNNSTKSWVIKDIKEMSCPFYGVILESSNPKVKRLVAQFMSQAEACYIDLLTVMCQNRPRQRQNFAHTILSWDSLHVSAENLERELAEMPDEVEQITISLPDRTEIPALPLSSWVYLRKLQIMIWVVLLGFELDIYKPWEYSRMFWYAHRLITALTDHLSRLKIFLQQRNERDASRYISELEYESMILGYLAQASFYLSMAFDITGFVKPPSDPRTGAELLYGIRMKPFTSVGVPELPQYSEFVDLCSHFNVELAAETAKTTAQAARSLLDKAGTPPPGSPNLESAVQGLEQLRRSAVAISVSAFVMARGNITEGSKATVNKTGTHSFFPVLSISK